MTVLKTKDQASFVFARFKAEVENSLGQKIKVIRLDRGGEFLSAAFKEICEQAGIARQLTTPYSSQQNGVVERRNRTVTEMSRSLLKSMKVPGRLWGEAVRHSVYFLNRLPTKAIGSRTPFEAWCGRKPQLGHVRIFGCKANVRPAEPYLKKLDDRSVPMVYLGVENGSKAHRLYNPNTKKIVVRRDVVFEEAEVWNWDATYSEGSDFVVEEVGNTGPQFQGVGAGSGASHDNHQLNDGGGASGVVQPTGEAIVSENAENQTQSVTVQNSTIEAEGSEIAEGGLDQNEMSLMIP